MKTGDKIWLFDINRRIYPKNGKGNPIYSEHFYQAIVSGETKRSWLVAGKKFSKKNPLGIYTNEQKSDAIWENENRYKIIEKIEFCSIDKLKQIENILNKQKVTQCPILGN